MEIRIKPLDTLFFRDGKPFSAGEETWADSYLLPPPSVLYGALRTLLAVENQIPFEEVESRLVPTISSIYYSIGGQNCFPLPLDLVEYPKEKEERQEEKKNKSYLVGTLVPIENPLAATSKEQRMKYLLVAKNYAATQVEEFSGGMLEYSNLQKYLAGDIQKAEALRLQDFVESESKIGIARDDFSKVASDSMLYRVGMKRTRVEVCIGFKEGGEFSGEAVGRLGGEMKLATFQKNRRQLNTAFANVSFAQSRFKVYFATPAILEDGTPTKRLETLGIKANLVAANVGKPVHLGGFDMKKRMPKKMYQAVPAGSVFYYESEGDLSQLSALQGESLSDYEDKRQEGFGIAYFGNWNLQAL